MLRDVLGYIGKNYLSAKTESFTHHPLGHYFRHETPAAIERAISATGLKIIGSCGQGQWATVPWVGLFDPVITEGARRGFYVVYLFSTDMTRVYLSINQGTTEVRDQFGLAEDALQELRLRATVMRERAPEYRVSFLSHAIALGSDQFLPRGYEAGHAFGRHYTMTRLPEEAALVKDLEEAIRLYRVLIVRGGYETLSEDEAAEIGLNRASVTEQRRYVAHRKIERNPKAAKEVKRVHGYICQACGFDFAAVYGAAAAGYIEAHHLVPLSEISEGQSVTLNVDKDFAVLCANCHRTIHRKDAPKTVAGLRQLPGVINLRTVIIGVLPQKSDNAAG